MWVGIGFSEGSDLVWQVRRDRITVFCPRQWGTVRDNTSATFLSGNPPGVSIRGNSTHYLNPRDVESARQGKVIAISQVGGLHHRYTRAA
jgi:hypothetical protein